MVGFVKLKEDTGGRYLHQSEWLKFTYNLVVALEMRLSYKSIQELSKLTFNRDAKKCVAHGHRSCAISGTKGLIELSGIRCFTKEGNIALDLSLTLRSYNYKNDCTFIRLFVNRK